METDADRLDAIQALGGSLCLIDGRQVWSLFDETPIESLTAPGVEGRATVMECRSSDVLNLVKDMPVEVGGEMYRIKRVERNSPAPGWTAIQLKR